MDMHINMVWDLANYGMRFLFFNLILRVLVYGGVVKVVDYVLVGLMDFVILAM